MTPPRETADAIAQAEAEATAANELLTALEERVKDGDPEVTPDQLAEQRELGKFAKLRAEAAHRRHDKAVTADREQRAKAAADAVRDLFDTDDVQPLIDAAQVARAAVEQLVTLARARNDALRTAALDVVRLNEEMRNADASGPWPITRFGVRAQEYPPAVTVLGAGHARSASPGELAAAVLRLALGDNATEQHQARDMLAGMPDARVRALGDAVPGLAEAWRATREEFEAADAHVRGLIMEQGRCPVAPPDGPTAA